MAEKNMTPEIKNYFQDIENYVGHKIYFYGSIHRFDYFSGDSDIDCDIFSNNPHGTMIKLQHYFLKSRSEFKKIITVIDGKVIKAYKMNHFESKLNLRCEFSLYPEWSKEKVLREHMKKTKLPFYGIVCLLILKFMFYTLHLMDTKSYKRIKNFILNYLVGFKESPFIIYRNEPFFQLN